MRPRIDGILESSLYVSDVPRSIRFYEETFGFTVIKDFGDRGCAMRAGTRQVLLLFKKGASRDIQSPHDGEGELHIAFSDNTQASDNGDCGSTKGMIFGIRERLAGS